MISGILFECTMKHMEQQLCARCQFSLTPETKMTTFDAKQNRLITCKDRSACDDRIYQEEKKAREERDRPFIEEANRLIKEFGHLPKEEQLTKMFGITMNDFSREEKTRGGVVNYYLSDGSKYVWHLFKHVWTNI